MARNWELTWTNFDFQSLDVVVVFFKPCAKARKRNIFMMMFVLALDFYFQFIAKMILA
jgi:hypothetical protein